MATAIDQVDSFEMEAKGRLNREERSNIGQFMTPQPIARFMASMFDMPAEINLLDAGAGSGALTKAFIKRACQAQRIPKKIAVTAYETDSTIINDLQQSLDECETLCEEAEINFTYTIIQEDFISAAAKLLERDLFSNQVHFSHAIVNPPYKKINSQSKHRIELRSVGIETSNLYTAFIELIARLLGDNGELVAITPRSFCNGSYFRNFRQHILENMTLKRLHLFESRGAAFQHDDVLQENIIYHMKKETPTREKVIITSSIGGDPNKEHLSYHSVPYNMVILPNDPDQFIHIITDELGYHICNIMGQLPSRIENIEVDVSTGRVVDFRAKQYLRKDPENNTVPLIYPLHLKQGSIAWPKQNSKKPNAIIASTDTQDLLVPEGIYVLIKRFTSKEEKRRVVATIFDPDHIKAQFVGFENHLNYFHMNQQGLQLPLARGITAYLNSTLVDSYIRLFNGHTQINASDLRKLPYPTKESLIEIGTHIGTEVANQDKIDQLIDQLIIKDYDTTNPIHIKKKIDDSCHFMKLLKIPTQDRTERSAITLLSLLNLEPKTPWSEAKGGPIKSKEMIVFFDKCYGKKFDPKYQKDKWLNHVDIFIKRNIAIERNQTYQITPHILRLAQRYGEGEISQ